MHKHSTTYYDVFIEGIKKLRSYNAIDEFERSLFYSSAISVMEAYLSSLLIGELKNHSSLLMKLAKTSKYAEQKVKIDFALSGKIDEWLVNSVKQLVFHRLPDVLVFYKNVLSVHTTSPRTIADAIKVRHDIIHRNGMNLEGMPITPIDMTILNKLYDDLEAFVSDIDAKVIFARSGY